MFDYNALKTFYYILVAVKRGLSSSCYTNSISFYSGSFCLVTGSLPYIGSWWSRLYL